MSMLSMQADRLRSWAEQFDERADLDALAPLLASDLREAADTIISLRDRLQAAELGSGTCELIHVMNEYDHSIPEWDHDECSKCGRWLDEDVNFCPGCGARVKAVKR